MVTIITKNGKQILGDSYADDAYFLGAAKHDFAEVASNVNAAESEDGEAKAKVTFTRKKKTAVAEGGC